MELIFWHWWIASVLLIVIEIVAPGTAYFLWLGIAAGVTGLVTWLLPALGWEWQVALFSVLAVTTILAWRRYAKNRPATVTDEPRLNRRGEQYIGRVFTLGEPIVNGYGKLRVDDTTWKVQGADLPVGSRVRVVGVDSTILKVALDDAPPT